VISPMSRKARGPELRKGLSTNPICNLQLVPETDRDMQPGVEERNANNMKERFSLEAITFIGDLYSFNEHIHVITSGVHYARHFQQDSIK